MDAYLKRCNNLVLNKYCILIYSTTYNMQYYQYPPHHHVTGRTGGLVGAIEFSYFYINVSLLSTTYTSTQWESMMALLLIPKSKSYTFCLK